MKNESQINISYEELNDPRIDQVLCKLQQQKTELRKQDKPINKEIRSRAFKKILLLFLAGFISLLILLVILYFGGSLIFNKSGTQQNKIDVANPKNKVIKINI
jgi:hypothetical protein